MFRRHNKIAESIQRPILSTPDGCEAEARFTLTADSGKFPPSQHFLVRMVCAGVQKGKPVVISNRFIQDSLVTQDRIDQDGLQAELGIRAKCFKCPRGPFTMGGLVVLEGGSDQPQKLEEM